MPLNVEAVLGLLGSTTFLKAVVSSSSLEGIHLSLNHIKLIDRFDELISTQCVERGKPFGDVYLYAAEKAKCSSRGVLSYRG